MKQHPGITHQFGPFRFDSAQRLLFRDEELVPLVPKAIDTLQVLLDRRGQVVEKAELMKRVWPDCVVEDVGLARNISLLRKALGDDAEKYIETIPRRGYRFVALADASAPGPGKAKPPVRPRFAWLTMIFGLVVLGLLIYWQFYWPSRFLPQQGRRASLAVLPLESLSPDLDREAFSQGFNDALVGEVSKLESVQLTSPSTVRRYRKLRIPTAIMARLLGLQVVLEGTAQKVGPQLRVSVRLADVHSGKLIWAESYGLAADDLDRSERAVSRAIAAEIGKRLSR